MSAIDREKLLAQVRGMSLPPGPDFAWVEAHRPFIAAAVALVEDAAPVLPAGPPYASESGHRLDPRCSALMPTDGKCDCGFAALPAGLPDVERLAAALHESGECNNWSPGYGRDTKGDMRAHARSAERILAALEGSATLPSDHSQGSADDREYATFMDWIEATLPGDRGRIPTPEDFDAMTEGEFDAFLIRTGIDARVRKTIAEPSDRGRETFEDEDDEADDMCPNCLTPWKCNGPHLYKQTAAYRRHPEGSSG